MDPCGSAHVCSLKIGVVGVLWHGQHDDQSTLSSGQQRPLETATTVSGRVTALTDWCKRQGRNIRGS